MFQGRLHGTNLKLEVGAIAGYTCCRLSLRVARAVGRAASEMRWGATAGPRTHARAVAAAAAAAAPLELETGQELDPTCTTPREPDDSRRDNQ